MRNAVSEIKKALGIDGQKTSFIGVISTVSPNGLVSVIAGDREEVVRTDGHFSVGDEVIVEAGSVVGLAEKTEMTVWLE